jgi:hypothetical protein
MMTGEQQMATSVFLPGGGRVQADREKTKEKDPYY